MSSVSHEFGPGLGGARGEGPRQCTITITPGEDPGTDLVRAVALPFASEGGVWMLLEPPMGRTEDENGVVTLRLERGPGPHALEHQRWLRARGVPAAPRGRKEKRHQTKAQAAARVAQVAALAPDWAEELDKAIERYMAMARRLLSGT